MHEIKMKMKTSVSFSAYSHSWRLRSSLCWGLMTLYQVQNHFQTPGHLCLNCLKTPQNRTDFSPQKTSTCRLLHISCWQTHLPIIEAKITTPILTTVLSHTLQPAWGKSCHLLLLSHCLLPWLHLLCPLSPSKYRLFTTLGFFCLSTRL